MNFPVLIDTIETLDKRLTWSEYFMSLAFLIASRSPSERLRVGAVIVKNNRIISAGYNGFPSGAEHQPIMRDGHEINTIHAEQNAIADAAARGVAIQGATMFITHSPCVHCAKFVLASGIDHVIWFHDYRLDPVALELLGDRCKKYTHACECAD